MTPMRALFLGIVFLISLIAAGISYDWPFGAGLLVMAGADLAAVAFLWWYAFGEVR